MTRGTAASGKERVRSEAANWFARLRGPDGDRLADEHQRWLAASPDNDTAWRELMAQWDRSKFLANTPAARARDLSSVAVWHRRAGPRRFAAGAAAILLVAVGLTLYEKPWTSATTEMTLSTRIGEIKTIALTDGSKVTLDAASSVKVKYDATSREVRMVDGLARFDVKPDAKRIFAVVTARGSVVTNGGIFDVDQTAAMVRITPLRGSLTFKDAQVQPGLNVNPSSLLRPGQHLLSSSGGSTLAQIAPSKVGEDWTTGMLTFDRERLGDAVAGMNRHNSQKIVLTDPALAGATITGAFKADEAMAFARAVAAMLTLDVQERRDGTLELSRKKKS